MDIARNFVDNNNLLTEYNVLDLGLNKNNTKTFLFYKTYDNKVLTLSSYYPVVFTDAVIIKTSSEEVIQYLNINKNGLVKTNDNIVFYDFSEKGYSHVEFNGWLLGFGNMDFDNVNINTINIQLTDDGFDRIPADPALPAILWDYKFNYPVKYEYRMHPLPEATWLIEYEWDEDINTQCARTGLRDDRLLEYIKILNNYEKRVIVNTMFALYGYEFKTTEWKNYFSKFLWYKPNSNIPNSIDIFDEYQKRLYEYLVK
jgi:hypothetical protein